MATAVSIWRVLASQEGVVRFTSAIDSDIWFYHETEIGESLWEAGELMAYVLHQPIQNYYHFNLSRDGSYTGIYIQVPLHLAYHWFILLGRPEKPTAAAA